MIHPHTNALAIFAKRDVENADLIAIVARKLAQESGFPVIVHTGDVELDLGGSRSVCYLMS